ncbi:hypothetical protein [Desulfosarcina sp.]|uniref:hypothetical protein n=1 Tax=Desulfosarcina sp. TaxID=2027861 RepID=UPI0029BC83BF|nr:hypothetical protein [Desulfosarcina sp.]MDX2453593.1 hypothetical protein [Desulfosarcina sp.]MDX2491300.1 hypothetical protein [Desulfosarcina sp.]
METVNAATLPRQRTNTFLTQHIVCQAAFSTTYTYSRRSGKTSPFSLNGYTKRSRTGWFYKQTQRVGRTCANQSQPQDMEKAP